MQKYSVFFDLGLEFLTMFTFTHKNFTMMPYKQSLYLVIVSVIIFLYFIFKWFYFDAKI